MKKWILLACTLTIAGSAGTSYASGPSIVGKAVAHYRIFRLKDRIKNQRERIDQGLTHNTLTTGEAQADRVVLDSVMGKMKTEAAANGSKMVMSKEQYAAYNTALDANSATIKEEKQYFYYYGPYSDSGTDYSYYHDTYAVPAAPAPSASEMKSMNPKIFELKDRIRSQRARITQGLKDGTLTATEAQAGRDVLTSVDKQMTADYKNAGSKNMTKEQYSLYNTTLDENSTVLHEERSYYYYYTPYYDRYSYWD